MFVSCVLGDDDHEHVMRRQRDLFLGASDWTQQPDNGLTDVQRQAWSTYRQALRDFPSTWEPSETADFPEPPQ